MQELDLGSLLGALLQDDRPLREQIKDLDANRNGRLSAQEQVNYMLGISHTPVLQPTAEAAGASALQTISQVNTQTPFPLTSPLRNLNTPEDVQQIFPRIVAQLERESGQRIFRRVEVMSVEQAQEVLTQVNPYAAGRSTERSL